MTTGPSRARRRVPLAFALALAAVGAVAVGAEWWSYPEERAIQIAETGGDQLGILVDKSHRLPEEYVPRGLVVLPPDVIRTKAEHKVKRELLEPLRRLNEAARADGVDLSVISGYRSYARQEVVYASWLRQQGGDVNTTDQFSARPGHSEHQLGTVVDFSTSEIADGIGPHFNQTKAARWLDEHAAQYGFRLSYPKGRERETGYMHEGWHWRFWGDAKPAR